MERLYRNIGLICKVILCALSGGGSIVGMICLFFRYCLYTTLKIIVGVISAICMVIWLLISGVMSCVSLARLCGFGEFGKTSVVKEVISPDQNYVAELVDVDEGALGGETLVNVKEVRQPEQQTQQAQRKEIPVLVGRLVPVTLPESIGGATMYKGEWGEFKSMALEWKDNRTLLINGKEYPVDLDEY